MDSGTDLTDCRRRALRTRHRSERATSRAWLTNLNLFGVWSIPVRNSDIGVTMTGILLAGVAYFWREILGMFGGLYRKYTDEAKLMEHSETLRRVA